MNIIEILKQPEGRRLEFKNIIPEANCLEKTVIAFSNDAGGEIGSNLPYYLKAKGKEAGTYIRVG